MNATKACVIALLPWLGGMGATPVAAAGAAGDIWRGVEQSNIVIRPTRNGRSGNMRRTLPCSYDERAGQMTQGESMSRHAFNTVYWKAPRSSSSAQSGTSYQSLTAYY
jgi:hypothetical protein